MNGSCLRFFQLGLPFFLLITFSNGTWGAELTVQIRSPNTYEAPGCQGAQPSVDEKTFALVPASLSEVTAL